MTADCIDPVSDPRIRHCEADLNGRHYHYLRAEPNGHFQGTIILVHGWPDLAIGWRNQIPMLIGLGYQVIAPDCIGYGGSEVLRVPPSSIENYTWKTHARDIQELAKQLDLGRVILGGHDWGGLIAYRVALWFPELVSHVFSVCTPYAAPAKNYISREKIVEQGMKNFTYQLQLKSGIVEERIVSREDIKSMLCAAYGGRTRSGELGFDVRVGFLFDNLAHIKTTPLVDGKTIDYYVDQYAKTGLHQTTCWYDSWERNFEDELQLARNQINVPVLFIQATKDAALPPWMSEGMEKYLPKLTRQSVQSSHWALWEAAEQVNDHIKTWLEQVNKSMSML